jgi:LCP family protein required for cell wall assembly
VEGSWTPGRAGARRGQLDPGQLDPEDLGPGDLGPGDFGPEDPGPGQGGAGTGMRRPVVEVPWDPDEEGPLRPPRRRRLRKVVLISLAALVVVIAGTGTAAYLVARHDLGSMHRIGNPFASIPDSARAQLPAGAAAKDETFLVSGLDSQSPGPAAGTSAAGRSAAGGQRARSDTLMLVHLIAGGAGAYVVSIPSDAWVPIPGHGHGTIDSAYLDGGSALMIETVEHLTGVRVDHFAIINWAGFSALTNALGGVTVSVPVTTYDPSSQLTWTPGLHHLNGTQALQYVTDRHGLLSGDVGLEQRQQEYLRGVLQELRRTGTLADPLSAGSVMHALTSAVSVDSTLSVSAMLHLALSMSGLQTSRIVFGTAPYLGGTAAERGQSVLRLNHAVGAGFWHAFEYDSLPAFMKAQGLKPFAPSAP